MNQDEENPYGLTGDDLAQSSEFLERVYCALAKKVPVVKMCQHCKRNICNRPRGLCWGCYYKPGIIEQYPSTSKYARRGVGNVTGVQPLPSFSTNAIPGTPEKLAILAIRAELKQQLFHPDDMRIDVTDLSLVIGGNLD